MLMDPYQRLYYI